MQKPPCRSAADRLASSTPHHGRKPGTGDYSSDQCLCPLRVTQTMGQCQTGLGRWHKMGNLYPKLTGRISHKVRLSKSPEECIFIVFDEEQHDRFLYVVAWLSDLQFQRR